MQLKNLKSVRERNYLTQVDLAKKAGVSEPTIVRIERGEEVRASTIRKLATALGVHPDELVGIDV